MEAEEEQYEKRAGCHVQGILRVYKLWSGISIVDNE
jgi:hypothetical protein